MAPSPNTRQRCYRSQIVRSTSILAFLVTVCLLCAAGCEDDACPDDESKTEAGLCGCGVPDGPDSDGDGLPNGCDVDSLLCATNGDCDDNRECTVEACVDETCVTQPGEEFCPWPAEATEEAVNLTDVEVLEDETSDLRRNLSGAVWNPVSRTLWLARNAGPAIIWALHDVGGELVLAADEDARAKWLSTGDANFGDLEGLTFASFEDTGAVFLLDESDSVISEWDLSEVGVAQRKRAWDLTAEMPAPTSYLGAEGLTFVPDRFLEAQGFRDEGGAIATSRYGTGGLFFVGHQDEGVVYVFDLDRRSDDYQYLGTFHTRADETAGLEFDASTGMLWVFHGGAALTLEATRLSWTEQTSDDGDVRKTFDSVLVYDGPDVPEGGSRNLEGFALMGVEDCVDGRRSAFITTDDGGDWSLIRYRNFPCR